MQRRRLPNSVTVDSALFRKGSSKLSSRKAKDETNTVEKTDATDDARAQSQPRPVTSKSNNDIANSKPVNKDQENCNSPLPSPTSTNVDVSSNLEGDLYADHHPHCDQTDSDTISHIPKSFSCDSVVDSTDQSIHPTWCPMIGWPDIFPDTSVVCATVLLAIPEIGESDYFAESPQQLTIDELKQLGIYGDDDDESETEEEDSVGDVSCDSSPANRDLSSSNKSQTDDFQWQSTMTEKTVNEVEPISVE